MGFIQLHHVTRLAPQIVNRHNNIGDGSKFPEQYEQSVRGRLMGLLKTAGIAGLTIFLGVAPALAQKAKDTLRLPANDPDA